MKILGLDFETTGLDTNTERIIEIGAVLWDTERKLPLELLSCLIKHEPHENVVLSEEIISIVGFHNEDVAAHGLVPKEAYKALHGLMNRAEYVVAHNGTSFDKPIYESEVNRLGLTEEAALVQRHWIDTRLDIAYPRHMTMRNAGYLEAEHKLVNPFPHRAVFDALTMLQMLSLYKIEDVVAQSKRATILICANVSFDDRSKAKALGYYWDGQTRQWLKNIKECQLEAERADAGFEVSIVGK